MNALALTDLGSWPLEVAQWKLVLQSEILAHQSIPQGQLLLGIGGYAVTLSFTDLEFRMFVS